MDWLDTKEIYTDRQITIIPVVPGMNPHIRAHDARVFVRDGEASLQVLFTDGCGDGDPDYVWHTSSYRFTQEEIDTIFREVLT